ncbi:unnamed protein product [Prorocentrum cordatum]|uniref:Rad60/SUMO-like domain-containing protein n=1 Tax=Prorocentrum cordatum TaxID=2364126 RepID=A0ABN9X878_9DINO|nr:unnamed protein product [Polarella glacialis]
MPSPATGSNCCRDRRPEIALHLDARVQIGRVVHAASHLGDGISAGGINVMVRWFNRVLAQGSDGTVVTTYKMKAGSPFGKFMSAWCSHHGIPEPEASFLHGDAELLPTQCALDLGWRPGGAVLTVHAMPREAASDADAAAASGGGAVGSGAPPPDERGVPEAREEPGLGPPAPAREGAAGASCGQHCDVRVVSAGRPVSQFRLKLSTKFGKMIHRWCETFGEGHEDVVFRWGRRNLGPEDTPAALGWSPTADGEEVEITAAPRGAAAPAARQKRAASAGAGAAEEPAVKRPATAYSLWAKRRRFEAAVCRRAVPDPGAGHCKLWAQPARGLLEHRAHGQLRTELQPELRGRAADQNRQLAAEWKALPEAAPALGRGARAFRVKGVAPASAPNQGEALSAAGPLGALRGHPLEPRPPRGADPSRAREAARGRPAGAAAARAAAPAAAALRPGERGASGPPPPPPPPPLAKTRHRGLRAIERACHEECDLPVGSQKAEVVAIWNLKAAHLARVTPSGLDLDAHSELRAVSRKTLEARSNFLAEEPKWPRMIHDLDPLMADDRVRATLQPRQAYDPRTSEHGEILLIDDGFARGVLDVSLCHAVGAERTNESLVAFGGCVWLLVRLTFNLKQESPMRKVIQAWCQRCEIPEAEASLRRQTLLKAARRVKH